MPTCKWICKIVLLNNIHHSVTSKLNMCSTNFVSFIPIFRTRRFLALFGPGPVNFWEKNLTPAWYTFMTLCRFKPYYILFLCPLYPWLCLCLCFQLVMYAGPTTNSKKVAEYGGNTFGFGSRSVLGSGWPKDLVKVYAM